MWRRYGDDLYAILVLAVFTVEALTLGFLTWDSIVRLTAGLDRGRLPLFVVGAVAVTALVVVTVSGYNIGLHVLSARGDRGQRQRLEQWTDRWVSVLFEGHTPPPGPLPSEAVDTLLDLREHLVGTEGERVEWLVRRYRLGEELVRRTRSSGGGRRRLSARLEALESLAKARLPYSFEPLLDLLDDREASVRLMAMRSLARTLARMPAGPGRDRAGDQLAQAILVADLPSGAVEGALLLLEGAAPRVMRQLLESAGRDAVGLPREIRAALAAHVLDAIGRLKILELSPEAARYTVHPQPEVRAAALRALGRLGILPPDTEPALRAALHDPVEFVRVQAARAAMLLPRDDARAVLWDLLGDDSWWVRRSAADALLRLGKEGPAALEHAGMAHPDRYARHMAVQVLLDAGRIDPGRARRLREAV